MMLSQNFLRNCQDGELIRKSSTEDRRKDFRRKRAQSLYPVASLSSEHSESVEESDEVPALLPLPVPASSSKSALTTAKLCKEMNRRLSVLPNIFRSEHSPGTSGHHKNSSDHSRKVEVHRYTDDPTVAWEMLKTKRPVKMVRPMPLDTDVRDEAVRFVCVSDIHSRPLDPRSIPQGDVLLVAGDFSAYGFPQEIRHFDAFLGKLPHTYKVLIAGNHELTFEPNFMKSSNLEKLIWNSSPKDGEALKKSLAETMAQEKIADPRSLLKHCIYLEDSSVELFGLKIYGTPWQPIFDGWAFNLPRGQELLDKWNLIPAGVDVLITHTPPLGHGDLTKGGVRGGCVELLNSVCTRIRPKYHVFGHIHEGAGCSTDGYTKFINACICDINMKPVNPPVLFDIALPQPNSKKKYLAAAKVKQNKRSLSVL